jgi:hypothetical protein
MLDSNAHVGGNAARDDAAPIPVVAPTGGVYGVEPQNHHQKELFTQIGLDWTQHYVPGPLYNYFFDEHTPYTLPGARGWVCDVYGHGASAMPYPAEITRDLLRARQDFIDWYNRPGSPTDPADASDPQYDYLAQMTLHEYLTMQKGFHPAVADFYTRFTVDALAGTSQQVNAYTAISFLSTEYHPMFSLPGGTSGIARHLIKWLIPDAIAGATTDALLVNPVRPHALDRPHQPVRMRQSAMVVRADTHTHGASVIYFAHGQFCRASAKAVILAGQSYTAQHLVAHLLEEETRQAWGQFKHAPVVTANVTLRRAAPLVDLGLGYQCYWWGSEHRADFVVADWTSASRHDRKRSTVLTFYGSNTTPAAEIHNARIKLLQTPFAEYENTLRTDLSRVLAGIDFDFDRDVTAIYVYRWGHGMVMPTLGFPFGTPTVQGRQIARTLAPRHRARRLLGCIAFAGQDVESSPSMESAMASGWRTCQEVLTQL